ncbi:hypothetical protein RP20_CCG016802 [Aedes albopictus]|nr:hypothetical protein RP20_CCG016802 [Aedes albopictus]
MAKPSPRTPPPGYSDYEHRGTHGFLKVAGKVSDAENSQRTIVVKSDPHITILPDSGSIATATTTASTNNC